MQDRAWGEIFNLSESSCRTDHHGVSVSSLHSSPMRGAPLTLVTEPAVQGLEKGPLLDVPSQGREQKGCPSAIPSFHPAFRQGSVQTRSSVFMYCWEMLLLISF